ncbi:TlpA family protein disulfide reductase [Frankia sp. AiPs1]|uniref:TlpA family protein disulfide reductase n=1 Tax=Frankia sp. AiPs1 TaxID=573493 RepID=UPI00204466BD|nr:TlpA disulfide reductase family protein [Frankia sp. AiPs1]MCM3922662.1 TlpA family protein disulfide reductase [Frankia sp. AiPs1]
MAGVVRDRAVGVRRLRRLRRVGLAAVAVSVAGLVAACSGGGGTVDATGGGGFNFVQQSAGKDFVPAADRHEAPKLAGKNLDGAAFDVASLRGKIVVVNFWASWCAPCRAETPGLVQLSKANPTVAFLGVNEKDPSGARAFVRDNGVTYPSIVDRLGTLAAGWPVAPGLPSTFVVDANGRIAARFTGPVVPEDDLKPVLTRLQAEA